MNVKNFFKIDLGRNVQEQFDFLASIVLNNSKIIVCGEIYTPLEVEIMSYITDFHEDPWMHSSYHQLNHLTWYFHGKTSNRYGVDLTFGSDTDGIYASMLIRRMINTHTGEELEGPSKVANYVLKKMGMTTISDFENTDRKGATQVANSQFYFDFKNNFNPSEIYAFPRNRQIIKSKKEWKSAEGINYFFKSYRYLTEFKKDDTANYLNYMWFVKTNAKIPLSLDSQINPTVHKKHLAEFDIGSKSNIDKILKLKSDTSKNYQLLGYYFSVKSNT